MSLGVSRRPREISSRLEVVVLLLLLLFTCGPLFTERTLAPFNAAGAVGSAQNIPGTMPASSSDGRGGRAGALPDSEDEKEALARRGVAGGNTLDCDVDGGRSLALVAGIRRIVVDVLEVPILCLKYGLEECLLGTTPEWFLLKSFRAGRDAVMITNGVSMEAARRMRMLAVMKFESVRVEISMAVVMDAALALWVGCCW